MRAFDDRIADPPDWMLDPQALLERLFVGRYQVGQAERLRQAFLNLNMAYTQERQDGERSFGGQHLHGSPLHNAVVRMRKLDPSPENAAIVEQLRKWALNRIFMPEKVRAHLGYPRKGS
ncbi:hypothetical protein LGR54_23600 [Ancylobacter sp. Lp-2]|uniref:hypothetical protein n=1 Tax=Ancylobacter sp. Lp-2 TaxID=2881339 RepID=UPI001E3000FD|nr:hypothetical protein [Ancylobacter sp. Lp-2]MCB4771600.1 hypothetical protein [Ancylobacter sp. Lp-2]